MESFKQICREAKGSIRINEPGIIYGYQDPGIVKREVWKDSVVHQLIKEAEVALKAGAAAIDVYDAVNGARPKDQAFPGRLERMLLESGLHPDDILPSGLTLLLHKLYDAYPPP
jgi:hypothetical protein